MKRKDDISPLPRKRQLLFNVAGIKASRAGQENNNLWRPYIASQRDKTGRVNLKARKRLPTARGQTRQPSTQAGAGLNWDADPNGSLP